ncbi:hypothetical protein CRI77_16600 [Mycolicibacterium duvalii]|uniref:Uncharacterized protein n=1 Tax=Mycolicibacterium duvalii TaxID=39688 RepID=A0A7I7K320_9MYCO|nr:hypothetical protein [Mycolicibacterium duvalii]MCV7367437.1 hypothetical protein [Mycolicibacterium duvalii]PEG39245.1 hypothetical protein CRI77_16600 [Mycolicibacterium duvalii]BBX17861.1 hypothetical protein MDUV_27210 [Mycolicibacterium duvalii]
MSEQQPAPDHAKHWMWFAGILLALGVVGVVASVVLMLPLAMATDACYEGIPDEVCQLSARGQNVLVFIPWVCLIVGTAVAVASAGVAVRFHRTPLLGLPLGIAAYLAMIPVGYGIALQA